MLLYYNNGAFFVPAAAADGPPDSEVYVPEPGAAGDRQPAVRQVRAGGQSTDAVYPVAQAAQRLLARVRGAQQSQRRRRRLSLRLPQGLDRPKLRQPLRHALQLPRLTASPRYVPPIIALSNQALNLMAQRLQIV